MMNHNSGDVGMIGNLEWIRGVHNISNTGIAEPDGISSFNCQYHLSTNPSSKL